MLAALAASAAALVSGPGPVADLGPGARATTDGARYAAMVRGDDTLRVYDAQARRRLRFALVGDCGRLASRGGAGRFLLACGDDERAVLIDARTRRHRTLHAKPAPKDVLATHWLGVGRRYAVYQWEYDDCDSLGCSYENHLIDLKTGRESVPGGTCWNDFDLPRLSHGNCPTGPSGGPALDRNGKYLTLLHGSEQAETVTSRCDDECDPQISGGYLSWSEASRHVLRSRVAKGRRRRVTTWRFHVRPTAAVARFGTWYLVSLPHHVLVLRR